MKKRFFSIFLCILTLLTLFSTFTLASSAESILVDTTVYGKLYSIDGDDFTGIRSPNIALHINNIPANAYVDFGFGIKVPEGFKQFYTYKLTFTVLNQDTSSATLFDSMTFNSVYFANESYWTEFCEDPYIDDGVISSSLGDIAKDINITFLTDTSTSALLKGTATVIFTCSSDTDMNIIVPFIYAHNTVAGANTITSMVQIEMYRDYDQQVYQDLVYQQQQAIKNEIEQGFSQTNDSLGEIKDALTGDGEYTPPDPQFQQGVDNLGDKEAEVMENITQPIKLPNGTTVQIDQDTLNNLKVYYDTAYNAPTYEETMGDQIEKIFDIFMPYLGTVIYLSLFLGLAIAFLTGRRLI